jgi:hypothetical protein
MAIIRLGFRVLPPAISKGILFNNTIEIKYSI